MVPSLTRREPFGGQRRPPASAETSDSATIVPAMKKILAALISTSAVIAIFLACGPSAQTRETVTKATIEAWMTDLSNWGRWGAEDQLGTVNLITPEKRKQAAALVKEGVSVSLARNVEKEEAPDNPAPFGHRMLSTETSSPADSSSATSTRSATTAWHTRTWTRSPTCRTRASPTTALK